MKQSTIYFWQNSIHLLIFSVLFNFGAYAQGSPDAPLSSSSTSGMSHATHKIHSNGYLGDTTELKFTNMTLGGEGTEFVIRSVNESGLVISSNSDLASNTTDNIVTFAPSGNVTIGQLAGLGNSSVMVNSDGRLSRGQQTLYTHEDMINTTSTNINSANIWMQVGPTVSFTKTSNTSSVEAELLSRVRYAGGTAEGVYFRVNITGISATQFTEAAVVDANNIDFVVAKSYFESLPAGTYSVYAQARTGAGTATGVSLDPGGWRGSILIKEHL